MIVLEHGVVTGSAEGEGYRTRLDSLGLGLRWIRERDRDRFGPAAARH